jgi:GrpB-like predicted nucleotidyltransferase (UPF0157 family)
VRYAVIEIVPYRERWPREFAEIAAPLRQALGDLAVRVDHIGSTSVPGLAAKDIIDVQVTVAAFDPQVDDALVTLGYRRREGIGGDHRPPGASGPDSDWTKQLYVEPAGHRRTNLHVRLQGRPNQRYPLLFRDYLRAHPASAEAYARLKLHLARLFDDTGVYADVKDPACDLIALAAEDWATATDWRPGPSDA